jgi:hypothetical protein
MLVHFRYEGKARRTLCGQRWRPGRRPPVWRREWSVCELPDATPEQVASRSRHSCPACANTAAANARASQQRQAPQPRLRRHFSEIDAEEGGF